MPEIISNIQRYTTNHIEKYGLTMLQFFILIKLFQAKSSLKISEISNSLDLPASSLTEMLDKLEDIDLIKRKRTSDDRRVVLIETTKKSKMLHNQIAKTNLHFVSEILNRLDRGEKRTALKIAKILKEYSHKITEETIKDIGEE